MEYKLTKKSVSNISFTDEQIPTKYNYFKNKGIFFSMK